MTPCHPSMQILVGPDWEVNRIKIHCPCSFKHTDLHSEILGQLFEKRENGWGKAFLSPCWACPFFPIDWTFDQPSPLFSPLAQCRILTTGAPCVCEYACEQGCLRIGVLPLCSRQSAGFCPGPWSATSAGHALSLEGKPFPNRPLVTYSNRAGQDPLDRSLSQPLFLPIELRTMFSYQTFWSSHTVIVTQHFWRSSPFGECVMTRKARHQIALPVSE